MTTELNNVQHIKNQGFKALTFLTEENFHPEHYLHCMVEYRLPQDYLDNHPEPEKLEQFSLPDWEHYYQKVKHDLPEDFTTLNKEELAYWVDHLISLSNRQCTAGQIPHASAGRHHRIDRRIHWEIENFVVNPTAIVACNNRILRTIEAVEQLVAYGEIMRQRYCANELCKFRSEVRVIRENGIIQIGMKKRKVECWIYLKEAAGMDADNLDAMQIWDYQVTVLIREGNTKRLLSVMRGKYIVPTRGRKSPDAEYFMLAMDEQSDDCNTAWKAITYEYFPKKGYQDICDYYRKEMVASFVTMELEVVSDYQENRLSAELITLFHESILEYISGEQLKAWSDQPKIDLLTEAAVYLFPVYGTPHNKTVHREHAFKPDKVNRPLHDVDKERRYTQLKSYFMSLKKTIPADIVVYDPWQYPIT